MTANDYIKAIHEILRDFGGHVAIYESVKINFFDNVTYLNDVYQGEKAGLDEIETYDEYGCDCTPIQIDCLSENDLKTVYDAMIEETN